MLYLHRKFRLLAICSVCFLIFGLVVVYQWESISASVVKVSDNLNSNLDRLDNFKTDGETQGTTLEETIDPVKELDGVNAKSESEQAEPEKSYKGISNPESDKESEDVSTSVSDENSTSNKNTDTDTDTDTDAVATPEHHSQMNNQDENSSSKEEHPEVQKTHSTDDESVHDADHVLSDLSIPANEHKLAYDPEIVSNSMYALNEDDVPVDEDMVTDQLNEYLEDSNPADLMKDWSIKIDTRLYGIDNEDFSKGNDIVKHFFTQILELIHGNRLSFPLKKRTNMKNGKTVIDPIIFYPNSYDTLSESECGTLFNFPRQFVEDLKTKHKIITDNLPDITPDFYSGNGYVIVGGGKYSWFSVLVIETLRKMGSTLPVEVFIPTAEEYETDFCEVTLPKLNARCITLSGIFDDSILKDIRITGYQYKSLALLASSFENAFLLDADTYPVINPDPLFESQLYNEYQMITWPDYWRRTTSPSFYEIRGTNVGKRVRHLNDLKTKFEHYRIENEDIDDEVLKNEVPLHDREGTLTDWTTESGEMLINKKIHFKPLLLALYYNLDGQFGYYPLLSQGGAGEGDKETFVAASNYYNLKYYQVYKMPDRAYGFYKYGDELVDTSIIQYSALKDYENLLQFTSEIEEMENRATEDEPFEYNYDSLYTDKFQIYNSVPMFYHVHETKMDPFELRKTKATYGLNEEKIRNLGGDFPRMDFDLEKFLWETINKHLCVENTKFDFFKIKPTGLVCGKFMETQLQFLEETNYKLLKYYVDAEPYDNFRRLN